MLCEICNKEYKSTHGLSVHLNKVHKITQKDYYDIYIGSQGYCKTCNKPTEFVNMKIGYKPHCNNSCAQKDKSTREKIRKTNLERYGYSNGNRDKVKEVCLQKYGTTSYLATKDCREKLKETNQRLYGTNTPFESTIIQEKVKKTNNERLGVDYPLSNQNVHEKAQANKLADINAYAKENNKLLLVNLVDLYGWGWLYDLDVPYTIYKHVALIDNSYLDSIINYSKNHPKLPKVSKYHKYNSGGKVISKAEKEIVDYIKSIYDGEIIENSFNIIKPYQLDIYLPKLKLAIEYNGIYWHSIKHKQKNYHQKKSLACKDLDIRLIHIYEFEDINDIKQLLYNAINNLETIDINKPCNLDKDNWKLYEQIGTFIKITKPKKILDFPEVYGSGEIIYR